MRRPENGKGRVLVCGVLLVFALLAIACHPRHRHVDGVHSVTDDENVCIEMHTTDVDFLATYNKLFKVLESDSFGWETRDTINFVITSVLECWQILDFDPEIEVHVYDAGDYSDCFNDFICIQWVTQSGSHDGDKDYSLVQIIFSATEVLDSNASRWAGYVNHEFGHAVGLADPRDDDRKVPDPDGESCLIELPSGIVAPVWSVMHDGYCSQVQADWPTFYDFYSFDENVK